MVINRPKDTMATVRDKHTAELKNINVPSEVAPAWFA